MRSAPTDLSISRLVKLNLKLILGNQYDSFLYKSVLEFKEALTTKIAKIRRDKPKDKYYTRFSKSYKIPSTNLKLKFESTISFRDYSNSRPQEEYAIDPRVTYVKITIPSCQGADHYNFNDVLNEAIAHVFDKEVLGVGK